MAGRKVFDGWRGGSSFPCWEGETGGNGWYWTSGDLFRKGGRERGLKKGTGSQSIPQNGATKKNMGGENLKVRNQRCLGEGDRTCVNIEL